MQSQSSGSRAVFVDPSGRRGRTVRRITWTLGGLVGLYAVLVLVALVLPVGMNRLTVPGLGPLLPGPVPATLADPAPTPAPEAVAPTVPADVTTTPSSRRATTPAPAGTASPAPTAVPSTAAPVPAPAATPSQAAGQGSSAADPGSAAADNGGRPTTKPTPASTHAAVPDPRPTKG